MQIEVVPSLAEPVGTLWKKLRGKEKGHFFVSTPLSGTPLPIYEWIVTHADWFTHWDTTRFILMDEMLEGKAPPFVYVPVTDPACYEGFARKHFLTPLEEKTKIAVAVVKPHPAYIEEFHKPIDLLILALGVQGNYANVMPGTPESVGWHAAHLTAEFQQSHTKAGSKSYAGARFREYGMSLGPQQVLAAKNVVVIISDKEKQKLAKQLLSYKAFDADFPLSIIHHPEVRDRVTIYATEDVGISA